MKSNISWDCWLLIKKCEEFIENTLEKSAKKKVWEDTVAFLAQHGEKGYKGLHQHIQGQKAIKSPNAVGAPMKSQPPALPHKPGSMENESAHTHGRIKTKVVHYPAKDEHGNETMRRRSMNVQEKHHFTWKGGKWNHTHTTESGTGLNKK